MTGSQLPRCQVMCFQNPVSIPGSNNGLWYPSYSWSRWVVTIYKLLYLLVSRLNVENTDMAAPNSWRQPATQVKGHSAANIDVTRKWEYQGITPTKYEYCAMYRLKDNGNVKVCCRGTNRQTCRRTSSVRRHKHFSHV